MNFYRGMGYLLMGATLLTACGGGGGTSSSLVENVIPVASSDNVTLNENQNMTIELSGTDANNDALTYTVVSAPSHGTYNDTVYTPVVDYVGADSFTFIANDGELDSLPATVTINILSDFDGDNIADITDTDDDNDGISDADEMTLGTDPLDSNSKPLDTDEDTIPDSLDTDDDNDGISDEDEETLGTDPLDANSKPLDTDGDGSPDSLDADDDNDGVSDEDELAAGTDPLDKTSRPADITITDNYHVESLGSNSEINTTVSLGSTPKDVYLLLSNYATQDGNVQITKSNKSTQNLEMASYKSMSEKPHIIHAPAYVEIFRKNLHKMLFEPSTTQDARNKSLKITPQRKDFTNANKRFYLEQTQSSFTDATARKIVSNISTNLGTKTLNVWVSNDSFDSGLGCSKAKCVTQEMVNALADTFLKSGSDNDIYDWVTNIYGEEWGVHNENQLILQNDEITILLTDIDGDNSTTGGVLGYFFAKDNFLNSVIPGSNERVMLYADAVLFANGEGSWGIDDYWPREMLSTLAHELQHVIHFYQKDVLKNVSSDVWVNEMLSESVEDVIATKLKHTGPRGVEYTNGSAGTSRNEEGRYPLFNRSNTLSLTQWTNSLENYSHVNAFGAYLTRNYGGAKVLHDTLHSNHANEQSVTAAVNKAANGTDKTFNDLLREWGVAVLLSDIDNLPSNLPTYNTGDFTEDSYGSSTYGLGSINFFNYAPSPLLSSSAGEVQKQGNYYYRVGTGLMGNITISLSLNGETEATLITKESK